MYATLLLSKYLSLRRSPEINCSSGSENRITALPSSIYSVTGLISRARMRLIASSTCSLSIFEPSAFAIWTEGRLLYTLGKAKTKPVINTKTTSIFSHEGYLFIIKSYLGCFNSSFWDYRRDRCFLNLYYYCFAYFNICIMLIN